MLCVRAYNRLDSLLVGRFASRPRLTGRGRDDVRSPGWWNGFLMFICFMYIYTDTHTTHIYIYTYSIGDSSCSVFLPLLDFLHIYIQLYGRSFPFKNSGGKYGDGGAVCYVYTISPKAETKNHSTVCISLTPSWRVYCWYMREGDEALVVIVVVGSSSRKVILTSVGYHA